MGILNMHFDRPGPGVEKDEPRKAGADRYVEVMVRDFPDLTKANLITALAGIPLAFLLYIAVQSFALIFAVLAGVIGGLIFFPFYCMLHDTILRALRDEPNYWWPTYRRVFAENWKGWLLPGIFFGIVVSLQVFVLIDCLWVQEDSSLWMWISLLLSVVLSTSLFSWLIPQMIVEDLPFSQILRNSLLLMFRYAKRTLGAAALQIILWAAMALLMPYSGVLLPFFAYWIILLGSCLAVYKPLNEELKLEELLAEKRAQEETK